MPIVTILFGLIVFVIIVSEYYAFRTGVPTVTSFPKARHKMVAALKKHLPASTNAVTIMDMGSGNGWLCRDIAYAFAHAKVIGLEISLFPYLFSALMRRLAGPPNLAFMRRDFWNYPCGDVDAVVLFLTGNKILTKIGAKLQRELKTGAIIIANDESLGNGWDPIEVIDNPTWGIIYSKLYVYRKSGVGSGGHSQ